MAPHVQSMRRSGVRSDIRTENQSEPKDSEVGPKLKPRGTDIGRRCLRIDRAHRSHIQLCAERASLPQLGRRLQSRPKKACRRAWPNAAPTPRSTAASAAA